MKAGVLAVALLFLDGSCAAFGQKLSDAEQELMQIRQAMSDRFAAAVAK